MKIESVIFLITGTCFGLIVGWVLGSQQAVSLQTTNISEPRVQASPNVNQPAVEPRVVDEQRIQTLVSAAEQNSSDPVPRVTLGNLYFDAEQFEEAVKWYEQALALDPRNVNVSTDLGVGYYYTDQPDRAIAQFEHSLEIDPAHTKTMLNMGIVKAFGQQDLEGAATVWRRLIEVTPDSPEGRAAQQALASLQSAHPDAALVSEEKQPGGVE